MPEDIRRCGGFPGGGRNALLRPQGGAWVPPPAELAALWGLWGFGSVSTASMPVLRKRFVLETRAPDGRPDLLPRLRLPPLNAFFHFSTAGRIIPCLEFVRVMAGIGSRMRPVSA